MKYGPMNAKIKNQNAAILFEELRLIGTLPSSPCDWCVQAGAVPVNDDSTYTPRAAA